MRNYLLAFFVLSVLAFSSCKQEPAPAPEGALPSEAQLQWHEMNYYAFAHFNMNTFTGNEWGYGDASPATFNPTELDCRQWARICKEAGMRGIILTAKHHDGFCLWPSAYTDYSVKNSPWKNGKGDVVKELSEACKEYGLKFGVYLSPWDRHQASYGTPEYITYFRNQLRELLTNYGDVFEVWFDGANGGTGYYGGAKEKRSVDKKTYYDWPNTFKLVHELQPQAIIFSDGGPGCRWVGNETGTAYRTNWNTLNAAEFSPGLSNLSDLNNGQEGGTDWIPAEVDVSTRPGWYYHPYEDHKVKSLSQLHDIYYQSVGRGANLLLNIPIDTRGLINEHDAAKLLELANQLKLDFARDLARGKKVLASSERGRAYKAANVTDGNTKTYWSTPDEVKTAAVEIDLGQPTELNRILLQEYIALGQRVRSFSVEVLSNGEWKQLAKETTIGYKRILKLPEVKASKVRVNIEDARACPTLSNIEIYHAPELLVEPEITRIKTGVVSIKGAEKNATILYTTDGTEPSLESTPYKSSFAFEKKGTIKAVVADLESGETSPVATATFDVPATKWRVIHPKESADKYDLIFDGKDYTCWRFAVQKMPVDVFIDLEEQLTIKGFCYTPAQDNQLGIVSNYQLLISSDGRNWGNAVSEGEFSNIRNSPVKQEQTFRAKKGRYVKFRVLSTIDDQQSVGIAEFSILTE